MAKDPRYLLDNDETDWEAERNANASWGWILGGLAAVVLVLVALSFARDTPKKTGYIPQVSELG